MLHNACNTVDLAVFGLLAVPVPIMPSLCASPAVLMPPSLLSSQVSHDLRELAPLVDAAWEMRPGGRLEASSPDRLPML